MAEQVEYGFAALAGIWREEVRDRYNNLQGHRISIPDRAIVGERIVSLIEALRTLERVVSGAL